MPRSRLIAIHPTAPPMPAPGEACNGCGVCCLAEPCPAGMLLTLRRRGACRLLAWDEAARRYRCGLLGSAVTAGPPLGGLSALWQRLARRWIAAGIGCDAALSVEPAAPPGAD